MIIETDVIYMMFELNTNITIAGSYIFRLKDVFGHRLDYFALEQHEEAIKLLDMYLDKL